MDEDWFIDALNNDDQFDDDEDFDCPTCNGSGTINPLTDQDLVLCLSAMECPSCDGSGQI